MFSRRRTNIFNLFSGVCVGVLTLLASFDSSCGQPQEATATFSSGGVEGNVKIVDGSMSIVLEIDDFSLIPEGESCFDGGIFYHIHEFWNDYSNSNLFGSSCGATNTGGHWDPWLGCGSATGNDYCESQGGCAFGSPVLGDTHDGTYECSSLADTNLYTCEVGDLSSIFGALDFEETDYGLEGGITASDFFLPPASYLKDRSMVFHCNDGTRAFCAPFKLYDDVSHPYQQQVTQNAPSMVAIFEDLTNSFIKLKNDGTTEIMIDLSSISIPHYCGNKINYRIYNDWTSSKKSEMYGNCNSNCVGSFYDPTGSCAPGSDHINCENGQLCSDPYYSYNCDWNDVSSRYSCAPGDLSGKFGGLYIGDGDKVFSFSNHDALMIQLNQLTDKSVVLECSNSNEIIACAQFEELDDNENPGSSPTSKPGSKSESESGSSSKSSSSGSGSGSSNRSGSSSSSGSGGSGSDSDSNSASKSGSSSGNSKSGSKSSSSGNSSGKKVSSSDSGGSSGEKWATEYGTWSSSNSGSGKKTSKSSSTSSSNKWSSNSGTWDVSSSSAKKTTSGSSSGSSGSSGSSSGSSNSKGSGSKGEKTSSSSSSSSGSNDNNDCGYGDIGEECEYNKIATWGITQASECNELFTMSGSIAGQVCVSKVDHDNIKITYSTNEGYYLSQVNAWIGCDKNAYPKNDDCPKLKHFPLQDKYLQDYLTSYSFVTTISNCYTCEHLSYCDYCDTYNQLLLYVIAQAQLVYYDSYHNSNYEIAYMDGEFICQNDYQFATRHELSFNVQCC